VFDFSVAMSSRRLILPTANKLFKRHFVAASDSGNVHRLPDLGYDYSALEPDINARIMELHHSKHHATYVANLNNALNDYADAEAKNDVQKMIALQPALRFNGGGHVNHSIFWTNLAPSSQGGGGEPVGEVAKAINDKFGSFETFKTKFSAQTVAVQGSGWGWLGVNPESKALETRAMPNQDPLLDLVPLLGIDVWEHVRLCVNMIAVFPGSVCVCVCVCVHHLLFLSVTK
jgi:Fe-Mn family superoxide dismutase